MFFILTFHDTLQGTAFTLHERQALGIHGLLPPVVSTPEIQEQRALRNIRGQANDLDRFIQLMDLQVAFYIMVQVFKNEEIFGCKTFEDKTTKLVTMQGTLKTSVSFPGFLNLPYSYWLQRTM